MSDAATDLNAETKVGAGTCSATQTTNPPCPWDFGNFRITGIWDRDTSGQLYANVTVLYDSSGTGSSYVTIGTYTFMSSNDVKCCQINSSTDIPSVLMNYHSADQFPQQIVITAIDTGNTAGSPKWFVGELELAN